MKPNRSATALALAFAAAPLLAAPPVGGFTGPDAVPLVDSAGASALPDDQVVKLRGYVVKSLGDEKYEFRDATGTVTVEIDAEDWGGVQATPELQVELVAEVDRKFGRVEFDVESVSALP